jgi:hypothetical protein
LSHRNNCVNAPATLVDVIREGGSDHGSDPCLLSTNADQANDVTVYLVEEDFGWNGRTTHWRPESIRGSGFL